MIKEIVNRKRQVVERADMSKNGLIFNRVYNAPTALIKQLSLRISV